MKGGGERLVLEMSKGLSKNHDVSIMTHYYDSNNTFDEFKKFKIISLSDKKIGNSVLSRGTSFSFKIMQTKIDLKPFDLFIVSSGGIAELITIRNHSKPIICSCLTPLRAVHDKIVIKWYLDKLYTSFFKKITFKSFSFVYGILEKIAWKNFSFVICISKTTQDRIKNSNLYDLKNTKVIYPGIDLKKFNPSEVYKKYFFLPGRINKFKRLELAIKAFKLVMDDKTLKDYQLIIAGHLSKKDEDYYNFLVNLIDGDKRIIIKAGLKDDEYLKLFRESYAVLFTAINEDYGFIPLEAQALGKPVISVNQGGPNETIIDNRSGFLVESKAENISEKMVFLAKNEKVVKQMGKNGRNNSLRFSWSNYNKEIEETINVVMKHENT